MSFAAELKKSVMKILKIKNTFLLLSTVLSLSSFAQKSGDIDSTWGSSGWVLTKHIPDNGEVFTDLILTTSGKIIQVGNTNVLKLSPLISMHNSNGTVDYSFGTNGYVHIENPGFHEVFRSVAVTWDNKILVVGWSNEFGKKSKGILMRFHPNGTIDNSFGTSGIVYFTQSNDVSTFPTTLNILNDNSIFVGLEISDGVNKNIGLCKFTQGGGLGISYGSNGYAIVDIPTSNQTLNSIDINPEGKILLAGRDNGNSGFLAILNANGNLDAGSLQSGIAINNLQPSMKINSAKFSHDGAIVAVGGFGAGNNIDGYIYKLKTNGQLDSTYGTNGELIYDIGTDNGLLFEDFYFDNKNGILVSGVAFGLSMQKAFATWLNEFGQSRCLLGPCSGKYVDMPLNPTSVSAKRITSDSNGGVLVSGYMKSPIYNGNNMYIVKLILEEEELSTLDIANQNNFFLYPNPITTSFKIEFEKNELLNEVNLISIEGKTVVVPREKYRAAGGEYSAG